MQVSCGQFVPTEKVAVINKADCPSRVLLTYEFFNLTLGYLMSHRNRRPMKFIVSSNTREVIVSRENLAFNFFFFAPHLDFLSRSRLSLSLGALHDEHNALMQFVIVVSNDSTHLSPQSYSRGSPITSTTVR